MIMFWGSGLRGLGFRGLGFRGLGFQGSGLRGSRFHVQGGRAQKHCDKSSLDRSVQCADQNR